MLLGVALFAAIVHSLNVCLNLIVNLPSGDIQGHILESGNGKEFFAFQEIPYAAPPIGENRFQEPKPPIPWTGTRAIFQNKRVCMQKAATAITPVPADMERSEDCLFINVYSPTKPEWGTTTFLPVLFWIHGGGFFYGSGARQYYDPKYLMDYDVVVVTMNYRLGPFGFLTTGDEVIPGNLGLKDTLAALNWTVENIHFFGGDPTRITVMGESAGSTSAGFMQLSKKSKGMVKGYILESGSPLSPYAYQDNFRHYAFKMANVLNSSFTSNNSKDLLNLLNEKTAVEIQDADVMNEGYTINPIGALGIWLPIIENSTHPNAYITEPMADSLARGNYNKVPLMTGMTSEESIYFLRLLTQDQLTYFKSELDKNSELTINPKLNIIPEQLKQAAEDYKKIYTTKTFMEDPGAYVKYCSEEVFATPNIRHAELVSFKSPAFLYEFAYKGSMGGLDAVPIYPGSNNVGHTEELHYLFGGLEGVQDDVKTYPKSDQLTMKRLLTLWTNFVKYQNPTPDKDELLGNVTWPSLVSGEPIKFLSINTTLVPSVNPKYYKEVKAVFDKYTKPPFTVY